MTAVLTATAAIKPGEQKIPVQKAEKSRIKEVNFNDLVFGKHYADHMLVADFENGEWKHAQIMPFQHLSMSPSNATLHYGQAIFEGIKAYKDMHGQAMIFRPRENWKRFNKSAVRMAMPEVPEWLFVEGMKQLIRLDQDWIPTEEGCSLYIRPFMINMDEFIGVRPGERFKFLIITSPSGAYFNKPIKLLVQDEFVRAFPGGVGFAKAAGNYGAAMYPTVLARQQGYDQILWTDGFEHKYLQECGTMNVFVIIGNKAITPDLEQGTILAGVTRDSVMELLRDLGLEVEERPISIDEVVIAHQQGNLREIFGTGTAASVAYVAQLTYKEHNIQLDTTRFSIAAKVLEQLDGIKTGKIADLRGWNVKV